MGYWLYSSILLLLLTGFIIVESINITTEDVTDLLNTSFTQVALWKDKTSDHSLNTGINQGTIFTTQASTFNNTSETHVSHSTDETDRVSSLITSEGKSTNIPQRASILEILPDTTRSPYQPAKPLSISSLSELTRATPIANSKLPMANTASLLSSSTTSAPYTQILTKTTSPSSNTHFSSQSTTRPSSLSSYLATSYNKPPSTLSSYLTAASSKPPSTLSSSLTSVSNKSPSSLRPYLTSTSSKPPSSLSSYDTSAPSRPPSSLSSYDTSASSKPPSSLGSYLTSTSSKQPSSLSSYDPSPPSRPPSSLSFNDTSAPSSPVIGSSSITSVMSASTILSMSVPRTVLQSASTTLSMSVPRTVSQASESPLDATSTKPSSATTIQPQASCYPGCKCTELGRKSSELIQITFHRYLQNMGVHLRADMVDEGLEQARNIFKLRPSLDIIVYFVMMECEFSKQSADIRIEDVVQGGIHPVYDMSIVLDVSCLGDVTLTWDKWIPDQHLFWLSMRNCNITTRHQIFTIPDGFPIWLMEFRNISSDWLEKIKLRSLPTLSFFTVTDTQLRALPDTWKDFNAPSLLYIDMQNNLLERYQCFVDNSSSIIETLNLAGNMLANAPSCVFGSNKVPGFVSLARNRIRAFQQTPAVVFNTLVLDLSGNGLESLDFFQASQLQNLDLSNNNLSTIQFDSLNDEGVKFLYSLDLSYNTIMSIEPKALHFLPVLKLLNVSHNKLSRFNERNGPVQSLNDIVIDLRFNHLITVPYSQGVKTMGTKFEILASWNRYKCDCSINDFLYIHKSGSTPHIKDAYDLYCESPWYLHGNQITTVNFKHSCPVVDNCPNSCRCLKNITTNVVNIQCSRFLKKYLPCHAPNSQSIVLDLSNSHITHLEFRTYLLVIKGLNLSHSNLRSVDNNVFPALQNSKFIDLRHNNLKWLPQTLLDLVVSKSSAVERIYLSGSPWRCTCDDIWFANWLSDNRNIVSDVSDVLCSNDPVKSLPIIYVTKEKLSCNPPMYITLAVCLGILAFIMVILLILACIYRYEIKVLLYVRYKWHPFDKIQQHHQETLEKPYDVFVSFSDHDASEWVTQSLVPFLEKQNPPFKLCLHYQHFQLGSPIAENIVHAVEKSVCTVVNISPDFINSDYGMYEFRTAHEQIFQEKRYRLLLILWEEVDQKSLDRTLQAYLKTHTYLKRNDKMFWNKLLYGLPERGSLPKRERRTAYVV